MNQEPRAIKQNFLDNRLLMVWGFLMLATLGLVAKLFTIQVLAGKELKNKAEERQQTTQRPFVPRRPIVDRYGDILAADQPSYTIYAHPQLFKTLVVEKGREKGKIKQLTNQEVAIALAPIFQSTPAQLLTKFNQKSSSILLGRRLSQDVRDRVAALKNDGLEILQSRLDYRRVYPQAEMAAEILGFVDFLNYKAGAGVELSQEKLLERKMREFRLNRSATGGFLPDQVTEEFLHHDDLRLKLTVDLRLQQVARKALKEQIAKWHGQRGVVIVMDAESGAIRSLVVEPTFDPNNYVKYPRERYVKNWAVSDLYEPGSTFKPLNVAIALENKAITPTTTFNDTGAVTIGTHTIRNSDKKGHGAITAAQVLQYSSNVGMVDMMRRLSPDVYHSWLERLELGHRVGIDLPGEAKGTIKDRKQFLRSPIEPAAAAFGQGLSLTPIQLVTLTGALANGGKLVTPYVVEGLFDSNGVRQDSPQRPEPRQVFSPSTTEAVLKMMELVVEQGTGKNAQVRGFEIAGKTGTAQQADKRGGYQAGNITSFVGVLPVNNPHRYVVFAAVDKPQQGAFGGTVAAPIVKEVMDALILVEEIIPVNGQVPLTSATPSAKP